MRGSLLFIFFYCNAQAQFIYDASLGAGFFASFLTTLSHVIWHDKTYVPLWVYWGDKNLYYQAGGYNGSTNVWEYYFEPIKYNIDELRPCKNLTGDIAPGCIKCMSFQTNEYRDPMYRRWVKKYIDKYIKIKAPIRHKINTFYYTNMAGKFNVGLHLRRTDHSLEVITSKIIDYINEANKYEGAQFFVATDDANALEFCKKKLNGKVIYYDSFRSVTGEPIHQPVDIKRPKMPRKAQYGEEVLIDAQLLSKCDVLIHGLSNVSTAALFFNPEMKEMQLGTLCPTCIGPDFPELKKHLSSKPVIVEIGARFGKNTGWLNYFWPQGKIYAFEPRKYAYKKLVAENSKFSNVFVYPYAITVKDGTYDFYEAGFLSSLLTPNDYFKQIFEFMKIKKTNVEGINIEKWARRNNINPVDALFLSGGNELEILESMNNLLDSVKVIIVTLYDERFLKNATSCSNLKSFLKMRAFDQAWGVFVSGWVTRYIFVKR